MAQVQLVARDVTNSDHELAVGNPQDVDDICSWFQNALLPDREWVEWVAERYEPNAPSE
jgi:hypothetical protein